MKFYKVGGCVRDYFIGKPSKDIDYSVDAPSYAAMKEEIERRGGEIYLENPEFFTIRANVPGMGACDFVLCRKDGQYFDGRRPDKVIHGTIDDDLARRDFTMNAIAQLENGEYYDPHDGIADIKDHMIRCVGSTSERFKEDGLRVLRALRFRVILEFNLSIDIHSFILLQDAREYLSGVSQDRIRDELRKMFKFNTYLTLDLLYRYDSLRRAIFYHHYDIWLEPTMKG